jgi:hypothetical protein
MLYVVFVMLVPLVLPTDWTIVPLTPTSQHAPVNCLLLQPPV